MTNLVKLTDIDKNLTVKTFNLDQNGLDIDYSLGDKELILVANPEQAASHLKANGLIEDYSGNGDLVCVETETSIYPWDHFAQVFTLSQSDALKLAINHEKDKAIRGVCDRFNRIPDLIKSMR